MATTDKGSEKICCPTCGAKTVEYTNPLNFVRALWSAGGEKVKAVDLDFADKRTNFHKMAYWGFAEQVERGVWTITARGIGFVEGVVRVPKFAIVIRNRVVRTEGPDISIDEVGKRFRRAKNFKQYPDFAAEVKEQLS